jgi:hypothetical protein
MTLSPPVTDDDPASVLRAAIDAGAFVDVTHVSEGGDITFRWPDPRSAGATMEITVTERQLEAMLRQKILDLTTAPERLS